MRRILKSSFVVTLAAAGLGLVPGAASATPIPPLSAGDTQAYAALTATGPRITSPITRTFRGPLTREYANGFRITCTTTLTVTISTIGTTLAAPVFSACTTNVAGCLPSAASSQSWGDRLVLDSVAVFRDRINVLITDTYSLGCPLPSGPFTSTGLVSPAVTGGTPASMTFTVGSGSVSGVLGSATVTGTLTGVAGEATYFRL